MKKFVQISMVIMATFLVLQVEASANNTSKYAGQEKRAITSLSPADIDELRKGGGWGLAKPAELNGVPGPAHLLELKDQIPLSADQVTQIEKLRETMRKQAITLGKKLISREAELDHSFRSNAVTPDTLRRLLNKIGEIRQELRYVHLSTHLKTPDILTQDQIARYNQLRGYDLSSRRHDSSQHKHGGGRHR